MLWKLADNVKYEDDCEVSVEGGFMARVDFVTKEKCLLSFFFLLNLALW